MSVGSHFAPLGTREAVSKRNGAVRKKRTDHIEREEMTDIISKSLDRDGVQALYESSLSMSTMLYQEALRTGETYLHGSFHGCSPKSPNEMLMEWFQEYRCWARHVKMFTPEQLEEKPENLILDKKSGNFALVARNQRSSVDFRGICRHDRDPSLKWEYHIAFSTLEEKEMLRLADIKEALAHDKESIQGEIYSLVVRQGGLKTETLHFFEEEIIEENYSESVVKGYRDVIEEMKLEIPFGRLVIFSGAPGVGKSFLLRSMISEIDNSVNILVPSKMASTLDNPELLSLLLGFRTRQNANECITFFIEDADACLAPRMSDNISVVSSLLNLTDGLFGTALNLRIITTTNAEKPDFDPAMVRAGRLLKHIEVPHLSPGEAERAYKRMTGKDTVFIGKTTLAEVYARSYDKEQEKTEKKAVGFGQAD